MAIPPLSSIGNLIERIDVFTFRNVGGVRIPKSRRKLAYHMSVDIIIESIDWNLYESDKSIPKTQFYGYATLVLNDCLTQPIPLTFPRTRIYYDWQWQAFCSWQDELLFWQNYQFHRKNDNSLALIMGSLGIDYEELEPILKPFSFKELPLREVRVKCPSNTQFRIEYVQMEPVPYTDRFGNVRDGSSQQEDGDKDNGLPPDGIQPKRNDPSNPFGGNKPALGASPESGFNLPVGTEGDNTSEVDPTNSDGYTPPDPEGTLYWYEVINRVKRPQFEGGCSVTRVDKTYYLLLNKDIEGNIQPFAPFPDPVPTGCNNGTTQTWGLQLTGGQRFGTGFSDGAPDLNKGKGMEKPADVLYYE
jgi:hypothetical protein